MVCSIKVDKICGIVSWKILHRARVVGFVNFTTKYDNIRTKNGRLWLVEIVDITYLFMSLYI